MSTLYDPQATISDSEFAAFQRLIQQLTGIHLSDAKKQLVFGRLRARVRQLGLDSFEQYFRLVSASTQADERQMVVDLLTTNETYFFREPRHFDLLRNEILPQRQRNRPLRVWSAASSSGEEAYSIAMVLADALGASRQAAWEVLGSDISRRVLDKARTGRYPLQRIDGIPSHLMTNWCAKGSAAQEGTLLVDAAIRERVRFQQINLNERLPDIGRFEVVFLRNMLIYFQPAAKNEIVRRVVDIMHPGAWLIVGHSESVKGSDERLQVHSPSVYRVAR
ncbi:MAG: protein-glutamate O-methyltransferase CheR [Pseudomonadota bacterium]|nr:protein-glutamate O-methyltransferase CheR [Pseudomonadota bacterium]MDE3106442.1 protein-glutamate O-methyltransferase CheR [Acidobacteriota bacterium]